MDKPFTSTALKENGAEEGLTVFKDDLIAEVFVFPTPEDAEGYKSAIDSDGTGSPTAVSGSVAFAGAPDDSQTDIDDLVEASGL